MEAKVASRHRVRHLHAGADATVHLRVGIEVHIAFAELLVVLRHFHQSLGEVLDADLGDGVAIARHRQHALRLERHGAHHGPHATAGMGQHVAVVVASHVDHFLPLHAVWPEEIKVDAERLRSNLGEHVFMLAKLAVDPLPLHDRARIVADVGVDLDEPLLREIERGLERMHAGGRLCHAGVGVGRRQSAVGHKARSVQACVAGGRLGRSRLLTTGVRSGHDGKHQGRGDRDGPTTHRNRPPVAAHDQPGQPGA